MIKEGTHDTGPEGNVPCLFCDNEMFIGVEELLYVSVYSNIWVVLNLLN